MCVSVSVSDREIVGTHRVLARHSRSPLAGPLATLPALGHLRRSSASSAATPPHTTASRDLYREPRRDNHRCKIISNSSEKSVYKRDILLTFVLLDTA